MKGEDFPQGDSSGPTGTKGPGQEFKGIRRSRLTLKVEPGEKLLWRKVDGEWALYLVDAHKQA